MAAAAATIKRKDGIVYAALKASYARNKGGGDRLVGRCLDIVAATAGKPTYNPQLLDWLCRAAILPEAMVGLSEDDEREQERMTGVAIAVDRLLTFAERCRGSSISDCGDANKTIAQVIAQQPVAPVPQFLNKIKRRARSHPRPRAGSRAQATVGFGQIAGGRTG